MTRELFYEICALIGGIAIVAVLVFGLFRFTNTASAATIVDQQTFDNSFALQNPNLRYAQSFSTNLVDQYLDTVTVLVAKDGTPTTDFRLTLLHGDNPGTADVIGFVDTTEASIVTTLNFDGTDFAQLVVDFSSQSLLLNSAENYFIELRRADTSSSGETYYFAFAADSDPYADGTMWRRNTGVWNITSGDNDEVWIVINTFEAAADETPTINSIAAATAQTAYDNTVGAVPSFITITAIPFALTSVIWLGLRWLARSLS